MRSDRRRPGRFSWGMLYWAIIGILIISILVSLIMLWSLFRREAKDVKSESDTQTEEANTAEGEGSEDGEATDASTDTSHQRDEDKDLTQDERYFRRSATASSELPDDGNVTYAARNVYDGDLNTAWTENAYGMGEGEWIEVSFDKKIPGALTIYNGYQKTEDLYYQNARVMEAEFEFTSGQKYSVTLNDEMGPQTVVFPDLKKTNSFKMTIISAYEGYRWDDNNITEIIIADVNEMKEDEEEDSYEESEKDFGTIINASPIN